MLSEATSLAELEAGVDKVRAETVRRVLEGIGPETAAAIARDVDAALPPTLGAGARRLRAARATERVLFERFGARVPTRDGWLPDPASAAR